MRQLIVHVPRGSGSDVKRLASELDAISTVMMEGERDGTPVDVVIAHLSNHNVGTFFDRVEDLPDVHVSFYPSGVLAMKPPPSEAADQVTDVDPLSPIEVFLAGHQSVGSWLGLTGYAAVAGAVAWVGLYVGNTYLLTAAMLVAPFAGPAMNSAIATASGDVMLLRRGVLRYFAALAITIAVTYILTLLIGPASPSARMITESQVSSFAVVLPLVAGAAGALFLQTSERASLVSGAAVGLLVAASLAPPAGVVGMAAGLGRWDMVGSAGYVLALQLVGIHLSGAVVFRLFGLSHLRARHGRGKKHLFPAGLVGTVILLAGLLTMQFTIPIHLNRLSVAEDVASAISDELAEAPLRAEHIETRFMKTEGDRPPVLLAEILIRRPDDLSMPLDSTSQMLSQRLHRRLAESWPEISPVLDIRWLSGR